MMATRERVLRCRCCGYVMVGGPVCEGCGLPELRELRSDEARAWEGADLVATGPERARMVQVRCGMEEK